ADNCTANPVVAWVSDVSDNQTCPETIIRTYSVTDDCDNQILVTQTITIDDTTNPTISCPDNMNDITCDVSGLEALSGFAFSTTPQTIDVAALVAAGGTASDNCGIQSLSYQDSQSGPCPTVVTRTFTVVDMCNNSSSCVQTMTLNAPAVTFTEPSDLTIDACDFADQSALDQAISNWVDAQTTALTNNIANGCDPQVAHDYVAQSITLCDGGSVNINWTITDLCETINTSATFTLTAADAITFTCPAPVSIPACETQTNIETAYNAWIAGFGFAGGCNPTDNLRSMPVLPADAYDNGADLTFTYTLNDLCATESCTSTFTVVPDLIAPTFTTQPYENCVDRLHWAIYDETNPIPVYNHKDPNLEKSPVDYRTMLPGETYLDVQDLADNCCDSEDLIINWRIDFSDTPNPITGDPVTHPSIIGRGQPSTHGSDILLWGDGVTFTTMTHTISYWVEDCNGNISAEQTETITITPRPQIIKMNE
ncbi:hypothetical protein, partial [Sunxiuqinia sp. sy24]|uniref:hypothetical protein n=1 Tax=Sunxiuqinia sp. sy24 TaxID=3461495 RepID=UPI004045B015